MTKLDDRVKYALDEARILILVAQVLLGFQLRLILEKGFDQLSRPEQFLQLGGLALLLVTLGAMIAPAAYHSIVERGQDSEVLNRFTTLMLGLALVPFGLGLGIDVYVAVHKVIGHTVAIVSAVAAIAIALWFWYGMEFVARYQRRRGQKDRDMSMKEERPPGGTPIKDKVAQVLTEVRMVLPGAQALLGFQFAVIFVEGFDKLPASSKHVHLASIAVIGMATILLMAPAAYHRIVEEGEESEHFWSLATRLLLAAMAVLAAGISLDFYVVVRKVTDSVRLGVLGGTVALLFFYGLWFGFTLAVRARRQLRRHQPASQRIGAAR